MNFKLKTSAAAILAVALVTSTAYAHAYAYDGNRDSNTPAKRHATKKPKTPPGPTVEEQIQILRQELQGQIDGLKTDLADKDAQLKKAQQAAADAQTSANKANTAAAAETTAVTDNAAAVTTLQSTVTDLKGNQASLA